MEESNFYHCFLLTAEDRKGLDLTSVPQDLLLRSSLHPYFAGRRVQVRQRQLESDLLYRNGGFPQSVCSQPSSKNLIGRNEKAETEECIHLNVDEHGATRSEPLRVNNHPLSKGWQSDVVFRGSPRTLGVSHNGTPSAEGDSSSVTHPQP